MDDMSQELEELRTGLGEVGDKVSEQTNVLSEIKNELSSIATNLQHNSNMTELTRALGSISWVLWFIFLAICFIGGAIIKKLGG